MITNVTRHEGATSNASLPMASVESDEATADARQWRGLVKIAMVLWLVLSHISLFELSGVFHPPLKIIIATQSATFVAFVITLAIRPASMRWTSRRATLYIVLGSSTFTAASGIQSVFLGGWGSSNMMGPAFAMMALAMLQRHWRQALVPNLAVSVAYILGQIAGHIGIGHTGELTVAAQNSGQLIAMAGFATMLSHRAWHLRRQVYESRSIGRYQLKVRLGRGGMGEVWSAFHSTLRRDVALKILRPSVTDGVTDAAAVQRFEREVQATSALVHPNTVRVYDYGVTDDGLWYYAMELLDGVNLARLVRAEGVVDCDRALHFGVQAARALGEAHRAGIVHRDVKPENLVVTRAGGEVDFLKVIDFGIARVMADDLALTKADQISGTPAFVAPEVASGALADARSDVYALGAVLYFLVTGVTPFSAATAPAMLLAHMREPVVPPSLRAPQRVPVVFELVILRCLEKDPDRRYADGTALADALMAAMKAGWLPKSRPLPRASIVHSTGSARREAAAVTSAEVTGIMQATADPTDAPTADAADDPNGEINPKPAA